MVEPDISAKSSVEIMNYKMVLLGDISVGKSSIIERFIKGGFTENSETTIAACFYEKIITLGSNPIRIAIWDTAGQEKYASLANFYYKNANAAFIVFDVSLIKTYDKAKLWLNELNEECSNSSIVKALVGNKIDLEERQIESNDAAKFAKDNKLLYFETSAKKGTGIEELFATVTKTLLERKVPLDNSEKSFLSQNSFQRRKECNC